jgi:ATP-dependent Lhr-like helicase
LIDRAEQWFSAQGWQPFDYQRQTWAAYLRGESGLVHAPTGAGKTLAVWLGPVLEWLGEQGQSAAPRSDPQAKPHRKRLKKRSDAAPVQVIWLTPLRALANDTADSLCTPIDGLDLPWTVELRTSDVASHIKQKQRQRLPSCLVTTPESLSLLLSYAQPEQRFGSLRCVIVDEWHELMGTKRGVQAELALARLKQCQPNLRIWGLSATMANLDQARQVLLGADAEAKTTRLIEGGPPRQIDLTTLMPPQIERFPWAGHLGTKLVEPVIETIEQAHSTLVFTNTRSQAELWFEGLLKRRTDWIGQIALHHGSMEQRLRRQVETLLREGQLKAVVCTSSLDLGVDFYPVDQVLQVGSPKGVARLMQRAGRSGHQPGQRSKIVGVPTHAFELLEFSAAREAMEARALEPRLPLTNPLDVLVQHLVTVAAGGGFDEQALFDEVRTTFAFGHLTAEQWQWAMQFVTGASPALTAYPQYARIMPEDAPTRYTIANQRIARWHRLGIGTITADTDIAIKYKSGHKLGTTEEHFISKLRLGDTFIFAGRVLELVQVKDMVATVQRSKKKRGAVPRWGGTRFPLSTHLAHYVRQRLEQVREGQAADVETQAITPLLQLQQRWSLLPSEDELLIEATRSREGTHRFIYPFLGRLVHEGLGALMAYRLSRDAPRSITFSANDYGIELLFPEKVTLHERDWRALLSEDNLLEDLLACLNETQMARAQFREIARIGGLVFTGYPGQGKTARQLQASSDLFYEVFRQYDPDNLLLTQARREVLDQQLEIRRLRDGLQRIAQMRLQLQETRRLSPLAFPLWAESLRAQHVSSEKWHQRIERMRDQLEALAGQ